MMFLIVFCVFFSPELSDVSIISHMGRSHGHWPQQHRLQCFYLAVQHMAGAGWPSESDRYGKASVWS